MTTGRINQVGTKPALKHHSVSRNPVLFGWQLPQEPKVLDTFLSNQVRESNAKLTDVTEN